MIEMVKKIKKFEEYTTDEVRRILKNNGWRTLWHRDNWVHESATNPDWSGHSIRSAFDKVPEENRTICG